MSDSYTDRYHDHLTSQGVQAPSSDAQTIEPTPSGSSWQGVDDALAPAPNTSYMSYLPVAKDTNTGAYRMALPGVARQFVQGVADLAKGPGGMTIDPATGVQNITPQATMALLGAAGRAPSSGRSLFAPAETAAPVADTAIPKTILPTPVTQGKFLLPATKSTPDLMDNFLQQRNASASYTPPDGAPLSGAPSPTQIQPPPLGQPMSLPPGFKTTLPNGQNVVTTGLHWIDDAGHTQVEIHHGNPAQTEWQPLTKLLGGGAAAGAGVVASNQAQAAPHPGAKVITDAVVPQYIQDIVNSTNQNQQMYKSDWANALNLLNPLRGVNIPSSFYGDQGTVGPAEKSDPQYQNRLTGVVQSELVRMPNDQYGYPLGTATTTAPVSQ